MPPHPDPRWNNIAGGVVDGRVQPMTFDVLSALAAEWAHLVPDGDMPPGTTSLLRVSRSLFAHSWFDYEFMAVACLTAFQAMEAAFRDLYPDADRTPLRALIKRARQESILPDNIAELADTGARMRNLFSHPERQTAASVGMAGSILENTHRLVALLHAQVGAQHAQPGG